MERLAKVEHDKLSTRLVCFVPLLGTSRLALQDKIQRPTSTVTPPPILMHESVPGIFLKPAP
jgi:hypothetical protein